MIIKSAEFVVSNSTQEKGPPPDKPEFAFIGRSNVGKSSLINMLVNRKNLAKTSGKPGKTQLINHFIINHSWYLVDLPGYGYAGVSRSIKKGWPRMIESYLVNRKNLYNTFVLIDCRLDPQRLDQEFIRWMGLSRLPFSLVFTKSDKVSGSGLSKSVSQWKEILQESWEELPPVFITSAETKAGREEVLGYIEAVLKLEQE